MPIFDQLLLKSKILEDLAFLLDSSTEPQQVRANVIRYLRRLNKSCPTPDCKHALSHDAFVCNGYETNAVIVKPEGENLSLKPVKTHPFTIPVVCRAFSSLRDQEKLNCRYCLAGSFCYRRELDGFYCHGCGFFIDFAEKKIGYAEEWRISRLESETPMGFHENTPKWCRTCLAKPVEYKFGDYYFCSTECLQKYLAP
ncbi:MAG: hypothetical protein HY619_01240 [Thaumarchaeota archaeon]|nr:hypothetical protein [Nitrososphaerota archaeon]